MCIWRLAQMQISLWGLSTTQMVAPSYCTCTGAGTGTGTGTGTGYRFRPVFPPTADAPAVHPPINRTGTCTNTVSTGRGARCKRL